MNRVQDTQGESLEKQLAGFFIIFEVQIVIKIYEDLVCYNPRINNIYLSTHFKCQ